MRHCLAGVTVLALALALAALPARGDEAQDRRAIEALCNTFTRGFITKNPELRASIYTEDATLLTPLGIFMTGRAQLIKDFGPEAQAIVRADTTASFTSYHFRFLSPDIAFVDAHLVVRNGHVNGKIVKVMPIDVAFTALRRNGAWLIQDERAVVARAGT